MNLTDQINPLMTKVAVTVRLKYHTNQAQDKGEGPENDTKIPPL